MAHSGPEDSWLQGVERHARRESRVASQHLAVRVWKTRMSHASEGYTMRNRFIPARRSAAHIHHMM